MKLSVSVSEEDVAVLDEHVRQAGLRSRSAEREAWEGAVGDGLS